MKKFLEELMLSPLAADRLLAQTPCSRKRRLRESRVRHFTSRLNTQRWNQWSGIILLDEDCGIIDGIHRVEAIARGYADVPVLVSMQADGPTSLQHRQVYGLLNGELTPTPRVLQADLGTLLKNMLES